tara:strand:+ start:709 stop:2244 length:1536 start_codon:yes stop_codon:yes gene_type:complete
MSIKKLTTEAIAELAARLIAPKYLTTLTSKEENKNALLLQEDREKNRAHKPKHKRQLLGASIGLFNPEIAGAVWNRLAKTSARINQFPDFQTLHAMTLDIITRYMSTPWHETLAGSATDSKVKEVSCGDKCAPCKIHREKGEHLNKADCKNLQIVITKAYPAMPEPETVKQWVIGLLIECCSWSYCENRGYLASDARLTHADWETVYRHAPKTQSLKPLGEMAQCFVENDRISGVLLAAWIDGKLDERTEEIIMLRATEKGVNTSSFPKGKPKKIGEDELRISLNASGIKSTRREVKSSLKNLAEIMSTAGYDTRGNWIHEELDAHQVSRGAGYQENTNASPTAGNTAGANAANASNQFARLSAEDRLRRASPRSTHRMDKERLIELLAAINEPRYSNYIGFGNAPKVNQLHIGRPRTPEGIKQATGIMLAEKKRLEEGDKNRIAKSAIKSLLPKDLATAHIDRNGEFKELNVMDEETRAVFGLPTTEEMEIWTERQTQRLATFEARLTQN